MQIKKRYQVQINGMSGVFSAFLVAFKHLIPEHRIAILGGRLSIRVKVSFVCVNKGVK